MKKEGKASRRRGRRSASAAPPPTPPTRPLPRAVDHSTAHLAHRTSPLGGRAARPARPRSPPSPGAPPPGRWVEGACPRPDAPRRARRPRAHPRPPPRRSDDYRTASRDDNLSELDNLRLDEPADGFTADQIENLEDVGASCKQQ